MCVIHSISSHSGTLNPLKPSDFVQIRADMTRGSQPQVTLCLSAVHLPPFNYRNNFHHLVTKLGVWLNRQCTILTNKHTGFVFLCYLTEMDKVELWKDVSPHTAIRLQLKLLWRRSGVGVAHTALVIELSTQTMCHTIRGCKDDKGPQCSHQFFPTNVAATCLNHNGTTLFILKVAVHFCRQTAATVLQTRRCVRQAVRRNVTFGK